MQYQNMQTIDDFQKQHNNSCVLSQINGFHLCLSRTCNLNLEYSISAIGDQRPVLQYM